MSTTRLNLLPYLQEWDGANLQLRLLAISSGQSSRSSDRPPNTAGTFFRDGPLLLRRPPRPGIRRNSPPRRLRRPSILFLHFLHRPKDCSMIWQRYLPSILPRRRQTLVGPDGRSANTCPLPTATQSDSRSIAAP